MPLSNRQAGNGRERERIVGERDRIDRIVGAGSDREALD